ncbi:hypothetical protein [Streptomyces sp. NRRL B-24484]|uniref:hypothetical protein n=1 Tax=Streptomyces sp. NRRL B-24484 TaxID=1463833 RepID=UPI0004C11B63|nr:hypothetical protein [Streptomyces sp. NRRL B-24484]
MLAAAGRSAPDGTETAVMYRGGDVAPGLPTAGSRPLAVLLTGPTRARFTDRHPLAALIEQLRPVEADFLAAVAAADGYAEETVGQDPAGVLDPALLDAARPD